MEYFLPSQTINSWDIFLAKADFDQILFTSIRIAAKFLIIRLPLIFNKDDFDQTPFNLAINSTGTIVLAISDTK